MTRAPDSVGAVGEVPEWALRELCKRAMVPWENYLAWCINEPAACRGIEAGARLLAAHEPAPVDPLAAIVKEACDLAYQDAIGGRVPDVNTAYVDAFIRHFRARLPAAAVAAVEGEG